MSIYRSQTSSTTMSQPQPAHLNPAISRSAPIPNPSLTSPPTTPAPTPTPAAPLSGVPLAMMGKRADSTGKQRRKNLIERIRHFTPSWFAVTMGTGVLPVVFHQLPYSLSPHLYYPSLVLLALNTLLLALFTLFTLARYTLFPGIFKLMLLHPQQSLFLGTIPMGFATAINAGTSLLVEERGWGGEGLLGFLWGAWWADLVLSAVVCVGMIHVVSTRHPLTLDSITATILLPFVPPIVAAALGAQVGTALAPLHPGRAQLTLFVSYASLGLGLPTAMLLLCLYTVRLVLYGAPPRGALTSVVLPLGPLGQGGLAFITLGQLSQKILSPSSLSSAPPTNSILNITMIGEMAYAFGVFTALVMWGFGLVWLGLAGETIGEAVWRGGGPRFGMPWWGLTFPLGVYTLLTLALSSSLSPTPLSYFLQAMGTALAGILFLIWVYVAARTLVLGIEGSMFDAPCLQTLEEMPALAGDGPGPEEEEVEMEARSLASAGGRTMTGREGREGREGSVITDI